MKIKLLDACNITTGKLDSNVAVECGKYPFFTCAPEPLRIDNYAFDDNVILLAGNNASGNFHCQRFQGKFNAYQRTYIFTAKTGYDIDYIYYNLLINLGHLKKKAQGSQTKFLTMTLLNEFTIDDLSYAMQKKISTSLYNIDSKIALNNKIISELESMAKILYEYWFLQFDFPNENGKPYKSSGGKMVYNEELKREIPVGWKVGTLYDIADYINGLPCQKYRPKENEDFLPVVKISEMHSGVKSDTELVSADIPEKNKIIPGDILFSWSATLEVMLWCGPNAGLNQHIFKVVPKNEYSREFVYQQISGYIINFIKMAESRKTTMGHITSDHMKQSRIILPPIKLVDKYTVFTKTLLDKIVLAQKENRDLASLRDFLLPMLMNGQVTFKDADEVHND